MAMNLGHGISVENLHVRRITHRRIVLRGDCGERVYIHVDDWSKLRTRIERAARIARRQEPSRQDQEMKRLRRSVEALNRSQLQHSRFDDEVAETMAKFEKDLPEPASAQ